MPASLTFQDSANALIVNPSIKTIVYEDNTGNKYAFGVDNATNVFNTFKYEPNGAAEVDYSTTATKFMTGGAIATLLDIGTNVDAIKTKTDNMPANLATELGTLAKTAELAPLAKTAELAPLVAPLAKTAELDPLAKTAELAPLVAPLAKTAELDPLAKTAELAPLVAPLAKTAELDPLAKTAELAPLVAPLAKTAELAPLVAPLAKTAELAPLVAPLAKTAELDPLAKTAELAPLVAPLAKTAELAPLVAPLAKTAELAPLVAPLAKTAELAPLVAPLAKTAELDPLAKTTDVAAIKAKTDKMPADLNAELGKLTAIGNAINGNGNVTQAAKAVLESSFKQAIEKAGENGSDWLENRVADIVSQPKFDIPASDDAALNWTW